MFSTVSNNSQLVDGTKFVGLAIAQKITNELLKWNPETNVENTCTTNDRSSEFSSTLILSEPEEFKKIIATTATEELSRFLKKPANEIVERAQEMAQFCKEILGRYYPGFSSISQTAIFKANDFNGIVKYLLWFNCDQFISWKNGQVPDQPPPPLSFGLL